MKQQGILNSDISRVLSYMGHTDTICIGDCGLPIPDETERIDLAVKFGQPSFMDVLHSDLKKMTKTCKAVIRTGETTPYANIILQSGCIF